MTRSFPAFLSLALLLTLIGRVVALYDDQDAVITFTKKSDFDTEVLQSDGIWVVQFYAPWCGHCKGLAPHYKEVAGLVKGIFHIGAVDATSPAGERIAAPYGVSGFPALLIFSNDKTAPEKYEGPRDGQHIVQALMDNVVKTIQERSRGAGSAGGSGSSSTSDQGPSRVVQLNSSNFQQEVLDNPLVSMVAFIAPWCGHCQALLPEWEVAARNVHGEGAFLGVVDATVETELASTYGVQGFPTIKVFPGGKNKSHADAMDYMGERSAQHIARHALEEVDRTGVPKEIPQLISSSVLTENCGGQNKLCVLAAFPHILDSGASGRNKYRDLLASVAKQFRGSAFTFLWFEGSSQPELEQALELTFGYPALVALSLDRQAYAVQHGSFGEKAIGSFLHSITSGRQATVKLDKIPEVVTVEPWDGQDGAPLDEEPPLSEIMGWDDDEGEL